jgi:hypothetical protein
MHSGQHTDTHAPSKIIMYLATLLLKAASISHAGSTQPKVTWKKDLYLTFIPKSACSNNPNLLSHSKQHTPIWTVREVTCAKEF